MDFMYGSMASKIHQLPIYPTICCFQNKNQTKENHRKFAMAKQTSCKQSLEIISNV